MHRRIQPRRMHSEAAGEGIHTVFVKVPCQLFDSGCRQNNAHAPFRNKLMFFVIMAANTL